MKYTIFTILLLAGAALTWALVHSDFDHSKSVNIGIVIDKTDSLLAQPSCEAIKKIVVPADCKWSEISVAVQPITGYDYNIVFKSHIQSEQSVISNPYSRNDEFDSFKTAICQNVDQVIKMPVGLPVSNIYNVLIRECNRIAATNADVQEEYIYSDLSQNMPDNFSIYNAADLRLAKTHSDQVIAKLKRFVLPLDLYKLKVHFIFQSTSSQQNDRFVLMSGIFKRILEEAGATVTIEANL